MALYNKHLCRLWT